MGEKIEMHYECEGCGRKLIEENCLRYVHFELASGNDSTLIFCPETFYGKEKNIWCLENTLYAMCLAMDEDQLNEKIPVTIEAEIHGPIVGRHPRITGKYPSLLGLKQAMKSRFNPDYERGDLNEANGKRLAGGDYLSSSPWLSEKARGRAIKEIIDGDEKDETR